MSEKPSFGMVIRAVTFVIVPLILMFGLPAAIALWPDSEYVPIWETTYAVLVLLAFIAFIATRFMKKRPPDHAGIGDDRSSEQGTQHEPGN